MCMSPLVYFFILLAMCIAVPFWLLSVMLLWTWMYKYLLRSLLSVFLDICLKVKWLHRKVVLLVTFLRICHTVFKRVAPFPSIIRKGSNLWCFGFFFLCFVFLFYNAHLVVWSGISLILICISLMTWDAKHLFMYLLAIHISSLEKCLFKSVANIWLGFYFLIYFEL